MKNMKIRNRLIFNYIILILLPIIIVSIALINVYSKSMIDLAQESAYKSLEQIDKSLSESVHEYRYHLDFFTKDNQIQDFFDRNGKISKTEADNLVNLLDGYTEYIENVSFIGLVDTSGTVISSEATARQSVDLNQQSWFLETIKDDKKINIKNFGVGENPFVNSVTKYTDVVLISRAFADKQTGEIQGTISAVITMSMFEKSISNITPITDGYFYVTDLQENIVYTPLFQKIIQPKNQEGYNLVNINSSVDGWKIWGVIPLQSVMTRLSELRLILIIVFGIMLALLIVLAVITSNSMVRPLKRLKKLMKKAEQGEFLQYFEYDSEDEIGQLCAGFNTMTAKIDQLLNQVYEEQHNKRKAEIEALQAHIKPHFLYNTLDTIHWMSKKYHADDVIETVDALATLFRIGLSKGKEIIKLEQEIEHVKSYLKIQKVRYSEIMDYSIEVDEGLEDLYLQKIILQPFVENALYHGIKESDNRGRINIHAYRIKDKLYIDISDNGIGIDESDLKMLRWSLKENKSGKTYGVLNVNQRLQLSYGDEYGVSIDSEKNKGTKITICHPIIDELE